MTNMPIFSISSFSFGYLETFYVHFYSLTFYLFMFCPLKVLGTGETVQ